MVARQDYLLLALCKASDGRMLPVQIQKTMFLLKQEAGGYLAGPFYEFVPYNYGPFCSAIYDDLAHLEAAGFVMKASGHSANWQFYSVTKDGVERGRQVSSDISSKLDSFLDAIVSWVKTQAFSGLLRSIYAKYPEYAVNSVFNR